MGEETTRDKAEKTLREIIHYSTMIEKIIASEFEEKSDDTLGTIC